MKTLYILRHAKSSRENPALADFDRPLLEKGLKKSRLITEFLLKHQVTIDLIISSPAVRALATAEIFARALKYPVEEIIQKKKLYLGNTDAYHELFFEVPDHVNSLMIVGHNQSITDFANQFMKTKLMNLPTSGIVSINLITDTWENASVAKKKTNFVVYPKLFEEE